MAELGRAHCPSPSLLVFHPLLVSSSRVISAYRTRTLTLLRTRHVAYFTLVTYLLCLPHDRGTSMQSTISSSKRNNSSCSSNPRQEEVSSVLRGTFFAVAD